MAANFSVTLLDSAGAPITDADVDLYSEGYKIGDFTSNGDGTYYIEVTASGKYTVWVDGHHQTELTDIYIPVDDLIAQGDVDDVTLEFSAGVLQVKNSGISATKLNSDVAGDGLVQNTGGSLSPAVDNSTIEIDSTSKKLQVKNGGIDTSQLSATLQDLLTQIQADIDSLETATTLNFAVETTLDSSKTISQNLERLQAAISALSSITSAVHPIYLDAVTDTGPTGSLSMPEYSIGTSLSDYVDLVAVGYMKQPGIRNAKLVFEAKYSEHPMFDNGYVRLYFNSGFNVEKMIDDTLTWTKYEIELDIEEMAITDILNVKVQAKNLDTAATLYIRNIQIYTS